MSLMLLIDSVVIVLLVAVLAGGWVLHRKLTQLRHSRAELEQFSQRFSESIERAEQSTAHLKISTEDLAEETKASQTLTDDLRFLIERGGTTADRLERAIQESRSVEPVVPFHRPASKAQAMARTAPTSAVGQAPPKRQTPSAAERELLKALRANK